MPSSPSSIGWHGLTTKRCNDAGLALVLIGLIVYHFTKFAILPPALIALVLLLMIWPRAFKPFAWFWFGLSELIGGVMSRVVLSILFFCIVTPIGCLRRLMGYDPMNMRQWKQAPTSVFVERNHQYTAKDLEQSF